MHWAFIVVCVVCLFILAQLCGGPFFPPLPPPPSLVPVSQLMISEHFGFYLVYSELPAFDAYSVAITCLSPKRALIQLYLLTPLLFWICLHAQPKRHFMAEDAPRGNMVGREDEQIEAVAILQLVHKALIALTLLISVVCQISTPP